jgi:hypothetical protein
LGRLAASSEVKKVRNQCSQKKPEMHAQIDAICQFWYGFGSFSSGVQIEASRGPKFNFLSHSP